MAFDKFRKDCAHRLPAQKQAAQVSEWIWPSRAFHFLPALM